MRFNFTVASIAAVLIAVAGVTLASARSSRSSSDDHHDARVIKVFEKTVQDEFIDVGAQNTLSLGDHFLFSSDLSRQRGGSVVGDDGGECTAVRVKSQQSGTFQCVVTARFSGGQITVQGLVDFTETGTPPPFDLAITGGTGAYEGADGHVNVKELSETESILTFHLDD